jgi:uncharacterized repeat protein (TIGR03803 family)
VKIFVKNPWFLSLLVACLCWKLPQPVAAQTFRTLHSFTGSIDGALPYAGVILSSNRLFATTSQGGSSNHGSVIVVNTDGTGFTTLHSFNGIDGYYPIGALILSGNTLYGTTANGGENSGTVFRLNTDGSGFTNLYNFTGAADGLAPSSLILSGSKLYGTTEGTSALPGPGQLGSVFTLNTDGTGFNTLYSFIGGTDGAYPHGLVLLSNTLYGATAGDDISIPSTVFAINTDGTGFTNIYVFTPAHEPLLTNLDGTNPGAELVISGNILYGTAAVGGVYGQGTVFRLNTDGSAFTNLHSFTSTSALYPYRNSDGANPNRLTLQGNTLYGVANSGGDYGYGTVFTVNTDGTDFATHYSFTEHSGPVDTNTDGEFPLGQLAVDGSTLYGTANLGGGSGFGTIFRITLPPQLTIISSGADVVLIWPANFTGFTLQSTTNPGSSVWSTNLPAPVVVNGQFTLTNPISGVQEFFRLSQ